MDRHCFWIIALYLHIPVVIAETGINQSTIGMSNNQTVDSTSVDFQSRVWDISAGDWSRYEMLMQSKGKYLWKDLDPITVLGLNARSESERNRYAKLLATQEYENAQKVILLDRAYNIAFHDLYGSLPIVDTSRLNISSAKASLLSVPKSQVNPVFGDRYIVFVNTRCSACNNMIKQILDSIELGVSVDIHFKNDTRQGITQWAAIQGISPDSVELGTITLNPDSSMYDKFGNPTEPSLFYYNKTANQVSEVK